MCDRCRRVTRSAPADPVNRPSAAARGYDRQWRKIRAAKLARDPLCERCQAAGRVTPAIDVHHRRKFRQGRSIDWGLKTAPANLESVCKSCHAHYGRIERRGG